MVIDQCLVAQPSQNITVAAINNPGFTDPSKPDQLAKVVNPDIQNPDIQNTTVALNPGETARVTLRVFSPTGDTGTAGTGTGSPDALFTGALEDLNKVGVVTTSHPVDTADANNNITTPQVTASIPLIVTTTLPDGTRLSAYSAALEQTGATAPFTFSLASGAMPPGVSNQRGRPDYRHAGCRGHVYVQHPVEGRQSADRDREPDDSRLRTDSRRGDDADRSRSEPALHHERRGDGWLRAVPAGPCPPARFPPA